MTTQQQTERDEREMLARWLTDTLEYVQNPENVANRDRLLALLRGDEPAKLDRYVVAWQEADSAFGHCDCDRSENCPHAAAVLRKHFEPSAEVVEAARMVKAHYSGGAYPHSITLADFILKGDQ